MADLAVRIRAEHQEVIASLRRSWLHGLACGRLLIEAHSLVPHGQWQQFIEGCDMSYRTAARYCQLASGFDSLTPDQQEEASQLPTMERALRFLLGSPEPEQAPDEGNMRYEVGPAFLAALRACSKSVAGSDDHRIVLRGVHLVAGGRIIRMESTDGHRMFHAVVPFEHEVPAADVVVAADLGSRAAPLFKSGQPVTMAIAEHEVEFSTTTARVAGRLIEGRYVAFEKRMTEILAYPRTAVVNVGLLMEAVKRAEIVTENIPAHPVVLRFGQHPDPDMLLVTDEAGQAETEIEGVSWEHEPFTIMVKSDYLLHYLAQEPVDSEVTLRFSDALSPMGIVGADGRCGAILPLRPYVPVSVADPAPKQDAPATVDAAHTVMAEPPRPEPVTPEIAHDHTESRRAPEMEVFDHHLRGVHLDLSEIEARAEFAAYRLEVLIDLRDRLSAIIERTRPTTIEGESRERASLKP